MVFLVIILVGRKVFLRVAMVLLFVIVFMRGQVMLGYPMVFIMILVWW